jgi:hypothetical protein
MAKKKGGRGRGNWQILCCQRDTKKNSFPLIATVYEAMLFLQGFRFVRTGLFLYIILKY